MLSTMFKIYPSLWFIASHSNLKAPWSEYSPGLLMFPDICDAIVSLPTPHPMPAALDPPNSTALTDKPCGTAAGVFLTPGRETTG